MGICCCCRKKETNNVISLYKANKECNNLINELYNQTWRKRDVQEEYKQFIRGVQTKTELRKNYNLSIQMSAELAKICNFFREVRGDGNCFYTAFGFQYLRMILLKDKPNQFAEFTKKYANIQMKIFSDNFNTENEKIQANLRTEFFKMISQLRMIKDKQKREESFIKQFQCYEDQQEMDCCLYGLSTIFFRNLANLVVDENDLATLLYDRENLLIWETECNNNEVVISALAKSLKIKILLVFFQNAGFELKKYEEQHEDQVILLIKPGHYNIGLYLEN
ncbi:unnamed protein product [Paramecium octaurelia]|uniref:OTU domain-containing protein n=1 Tax=Paramecium octaurelia TaxID=43137 RepID=A0A8S1XE11_PAROT|nr:unnamed protein product [Paramecium octaurelia]